MEISRSQIMGNFIVKELKKAPNNCMIRSKLWKLFSLSHHFNDDDSSALMSIAVKNLLNNAKVEVIFIDNKKYVKLK